MKKIISLAAIGALSMSPAVTGAAFASDLQSHCEAIAAESGGDASGCACLAEAADDTAAAELLAVTAPEDIENLSDATRQVLAICFPDA